VTQLTTAASAQLAELFEKMRGILPAEEFVRLAGKDLNTVGGIAYTEVDLSKLPTAAGAFQAIDDSGFILHCLERDSAKGALLRVWIGGEIRAVGPGDTVVGQYSSFKLGLHPDSVTTGTVRFLRTLSPWANFIPAASAKDNPSAAQLLGSGTTTAKMVQVTVAAQPNLITQAAGAFDITGWKKIRIRTTGDDGGGHTLGAAGGFSLLPWTNPERVAGVANWFPQNDQVITDAGMADGGANNLRCYVMQVTGRGLMYLEPFSAGTLTQLPLFVEGIE
jgi:hypothetical protein